MLADAEHLSPTHNRPVGVEWMEMSSQMPMERAQTSSINVQSHALMRGERKLAQQAMSRRALTLFCNLMERSANGEVNMNGSRRKSYHGVRLNSEGPKHSEVGGCLQNPKWAFGGKLTDENA